MSNLLTIQHAITGRPMADLVAGYAGRGYGDLKTDTAELVVELIAPMRERVREYMADEAGLMRLAAIGAERARATAHATLAEVYDRVGFLPLS